MSGQFLAPAVLPPGNIHRYSLNNKLRRPCSPSGLFGEEEKSLALWEIFFNTFLLLAYIGSTFGSYVQMILYSVLKFMSIREQKQERNNKVNKYIVCPCEGSGKLFRPIVRP
jgi:hypothetical protein